MKDSYIVANDRLSKINWNLRNSPMDLKTLLIRYFRCLPKFKLSSKNIATRFWYEAWFTSKLLKINTGWFGFLIFREKNDLSLLRRIKVKTHLRLISLVSHLKQVIIYVICRFISITNNWKRELLSAKA